MAKGKNMIKMVNYILKGNILMEQRTEKEKNMIFIKVNQNSKVNIIIIAESKEKNILIKGWNMKVNIYLMKNGMAKDMMKTVIYMNYIMEQVK